MTYLRRQQWQPVYLIQVEVAPGIWQTQQRLLRKVQAATAENALRRAQDENGLLPRACIAIVNFVKE